MRQLTSHLTPRIGVRGASIENTSSDHSRKVRLSHFQNWFKKYDGSSEPYDHLATFKHGTTAEQIRDLHTQFEGFGLTLISNPRT